ncbi:MAG: acyl-CoA dehydrogenase family protein [Dehalococcoidia bacterium]|nr:acyl-CoA dehydrogenase family protein [Dehalococcoidia bacterium]
MNSLLTENELSFKKDVRDFVNQELMPHVEEWERRKQYATESVKKFADYGLFGILVPPEYGGLGGTVMEYLIASIEVARASVSLAAVFGSPAGIFTDAILKYGTDEQKKRYVPPVISGDKIAIFALTEPGAGSDAAAIATTATKAGDDWILNGSKQFITAADVGDVAIVFASVDRSLGAKGITAFVVDKSTPGFTVGKVETMLGLHASSAGELFFRDCRIPGDAVLGEVGKGLRIAFSSLDLGRIHVAGQGVGLAEAALEATLTYTANREQFGRPIGDFQGVQWMLADMSIMVDNASLLCYRAARAADAGKPYSAHAAKAKLYASEIAAKVAHDAVALHGGYGCTLDMPVERYYRDAKLIEIYEGTAEIHRTVVARSLRA